RVFGRDTTRRDAFIGKLQSQGFDFTVHAAGTVADATAVAPIVTLVTRAREPFLTGEMLSPGTHINAVGAITPERAEFRSDILFRESVVCADDPLAARRLSQEFMSFYGGDESEWAAVKPLSEIVAAGHGRQPGYDLSVFKAMGMGLSDLALGIEIYRRAL